MKRKTLALMGIVMTAILVLSGMVVASPPNRGTDTANAPPEFVEDLPESKLTKIVFIRYAPGFQKERPCDGDGVCGPDEKWQFCSDCSKPGGEEEKPTACYDFLAGSKPRWNWVEDYYYSDSTLENPSDSAVSTWEGATSGDIFGNGVSESNPWGVYDNKNAISFGNYEDPNVIAVTAIWFRGKNIYEYDIMFDTDYFPSSHIDLPTVVLHEFGHAAGLGDLYDPVCVDNVMYGYLSEDEVKTTLRDGDTAGIQTLYGEA